MIKIKASDPVQAAPGLIREVLGYESQVMLVKVSFDKDAVGVLHTHPHQQVSHILDGSFKVTVDGKQEVLSAGDSFSVSSGVEHGVICLKAGIILDAFSPARGDFIDI